MSIVDFLSSLSQQEIAIGFPTRFSFRAAAAAASRIAGEYLVNK